MVECSIITELFEQVAFDIVRPFPKAKGGYRHVLTSIRMGLKWPEAIALKSITAKVVAEGMVGVFSRTGLPLQILGVERIRMTAYHPQTNGVVERMHSSLTGMLNKAHNLGMDWAQQLPYALLALRQMPNRDTGLSPFELVYGRDVRTPLDLVYGEWTGTQGKEMDVCSWVGQIQERL